ncbi:MAG: type II toxin-antitoxin system RelE/ParE family toxin [Allomuricauda sp.]
MNDLYEVQWTERSLSNALEIKAYLKRRFSGKEIVRFEELLKQFENIVSNFPTLYPESHNQKYLRRAVVHKNTTIYYIFKKDKVTVIAMKDNRQLKPSR